MSEQLKQGAFRVWCGKAKCYANPGQFYLGMNGALLEHYDWETPSDCPLPDCVVERWTGRKKLYEGDVVPWSAILHEVVWFGGGFALKPLGEDTNICCEIFGLDDDELPDAIGTVHDNPEALAATAKAVSQ